MNKIDMSTILSTYEGHKIFSIFFDSIQIYDQILSQMQEQEFP